MDVYNFKLNNAFAKNSKKYQSKPVRAAKYVPGIESGFMVYFANKLVKEEESIIYEGIRFFSTEPEAWDYINAGHKQYINDGGKIIEVSVEYDEPKPVLHRKDENAINMGGMHFCFGENAFINDESCDYEFYILERDCWIVQETNGSIRVWYPDSEETFFGKETDIVYEITGEREYIKIAV